MTSMKKSVLAAAILVGTPLLTGNTVYQWTDEDGVVHFSQTAPENKNQAAVETTIRSAAMTGGTFAPPAIEPESGPEAETAPKTTSEAQPAAGYTKNSEACAKAREMLATLNTGRRLRLRDPDTGEITYASDEDLAEQRRRADSQIASDC